MRALVTGAAGFVGGHLLRLLCRLGHEPHALVLQHESLHPEHGGLPTHRASVTDEGALAKVLADVKPDWIFHLAAISRPADCRANPTLAREVNIRGTENLYRAAAENCPAARVLFIGSAVEYGRPASSAPIAEETPLDPQDVYAETKVAGDLLGAQYARDGKLAVIRVRPFNHTGPGQEPGFVAPDFARQIARIEASVQEPRMQVGNLDARRDFTDVRDVVRAYVLVLERCAPGSVFNVCSGNAVPIRDILDGLLAASAARPEIVSVVAKKGTERGTEKGTVPMLGPSPSPDIVVGSPAALRAATGWKPEIPLPQTLSDLLADWRVRVARNPKA